MTDLEACVEAPGRAELVKQVREKINELGITYIYYQFISVTGRIVGKGIPCSVTVKKPTENEQTRRSQVLLSQLSREETPETSDVGAIFAETTRLVCPK